MSAAPFPGLTVAQNQLSPSFCFSTRHVLISYCVWLVEVKFSWNVRTEAEPLFLPSLAGIRAKFESVCGG